MTDAAQDDASPPPQVYFTLTGIPGNPVFQEVSGIETETQIIEYRASNNAVFSTIKMPGLVKAGNITLMNGVLDADQAVWTWYNSIKMNTITRSNYVISMMTQAGELVGKWQIIGAYPVKISGPVMKADGRELTIQRIEIAHGGIYYSPGK